ncbi:bifunctional DNA-formamidopyrimidine glycosylase/DNA-(apurinic or apyrimidinic site) lyase [candidate division KSB1 bacterium]|nr:bifunctional DNA-formamidopyrimidine glycosylase/DNA-(apurinic or apyrimidinic site) lyase [candidate division KSB1 bacterium]NIR68636.1 bifunctional DNA-formamidopyrimidine glycosylase/DNA-(apurinic or apyrimidinic site) lyase [candidate division KSB1 bacterium]NIS22734.1 bifunctional DNA-formamidopyrimidine glycosylase/DNA-(apurinic or apyrimidinic site) lyase [candidate division KSB1 bacterium]NIU23236.1 bifunctional DNA-formamidopyrimidine glycosylase/DNA-(apurinic or apyrimidinic site) l
MPELPEVETIRRALSKHVLGKRFQRVLVRDRRLRWPVDELKLRQGIIGQEITRIDRRAKYLLIRLKDDRTLIIHLGMSGKLLLLANSTPFEKHDHVIFYFDDGTELRFRDTRRFGMVDMIHENEMAAYPRFVNLGYEPLARKTTAEVLFERAKSLKKPIKNLLMDANFIVGVGNIYANEALFYAGIHPQKPAYQLGKGDWQRLLHELRGVLRRAIRKGGTTLTDFVDSNGDTGYFQLSLAVYGKTGETCPRCQSIIEKFVQVGRSTYVCPGCQVA